MLAVSQGIGRVTFQGPSSQVIPMNITDVVVVGGPLVLASAAEVDALESRLWIRFPSGYRDYMERLGEGHIGVVRIYPPWRIEKELVEWRRRIQKFWRWNETPELLPKERAVECVIVGDTSGGDELIFHPCRSDKLFALPHGGAGAFEVGSDLLEAVEWVFSSGQLTDSFPEREFEPYDSRTNAEADKVIDPEGERLDDIVKLSRRWIERHSAREWRQKHSDALKGFTDYCGSSYTTTELIFEGIVLTDNVYSWNGYVLKYSVMDAESKSKLGVMEILQSFDSVKCYSTMYSFFRERATDKVWQASGSNVCETTLFHFSPHPSTLNPKLSQVHLGSQ